MQYKTGRSNHDFQIKYFLAASCFTPDAAYSLMCDLFDDRDNAIKMFEASKLREQAKIVRANRLIASADEAERLEGQADLVEIEAMRETTEKNLAAAIAERATIQQCKDVLEPLRKYSNLPLIEAHEAAQEEEWKLELMHRAENYILTTGSIPTDHFATMRLHPAFKDEIFPLVNHIQMLVRTRDVESSRLELSNMLVGKKKFDLPTLLLLNAETAKLDTTSCVS